MYYYRVSYKNGTKKVINSVKPIRNAKEIENCYYIEPLGILKYCGLKTLEHKKIIKKAILIAFGITSLVVATTIGTFWHTMNNLVIEVNPEGTGALVECFGEVWYHDVKISK